MAQTLETLYPGMKEYLAEISEDHEIEGVESVLSAGPEQLDKLTVWPLVVSSVGGFIGLLGYFGIWVSLTHHKLNGPVTSFFVNNLAIPFTVVGTLLYLLGIFWIYAIRRIEAQYRLLIALLRAIDLVDCPILRSSPASEPRKRLARQLLECAKRVSYLGPWAARKLDCKVIRQQTVRASQVLCYCVYPALLGDDDEIIAIQTVLAKAALKVGVGNWVEIGELTIEVSRYEIIPAVKRHRWWSQLDPIGLAALTAIPAIPVVVSLLK